MEGFEIKPWKEKRKENLTENIAIHIIGIRVCVHFTNPRRRFISESGVLFQTGVLLQSLEWYHVRNCSKLFGEYGPANRRRKSCDDRTVTFNPPRIRSSRPADATPSRDPPRAPCPGPVRGVGVVSKRDGHSTNPHTTSGSVVREFLTGDTWRNEMGGGRPRVVVGR